MSNNNGDDQNVDEEVSEDNEDNSQASTSRDELSKNLISPGSNVTTNPGIKNS